MNAQDFLDQVLSPNAKALRDSPDDIRLAINAILTADAFFGVKWAESLQSVFPRQCGRQGDLHYRDHVAQNQCYELVRDTAFAIKHGVLTTSTPRLVRRAEQTQAMKAVWDDNDVWSDDDIWIDDLIIVDAGTDGRYRADKLVEEVVHVAREELARTDRSPLARRTPLADIKSVLN